MNENSEPCPICGTPFPDLSQLHDRTTKELVSITGACERSAARWIKGSHRPSGLYLKALRDAGVL